MSNHVPGLRRIVCTLALGVALAAGACSTELSPPTAVILVGEGPVAIGKSVQLDGSSSTDQGGQALAYHWRLVSSPNGSAASIRDAAATITTITPDVTGDYVVELVVSDGALTSLPVTATFAAGPCGAAAPVASGMAIAPASPNAGDAVRISAEASDPDADAACGLDERLTYRWTLTAVPLGSQASFNDPSLARPSLLTDEPGDYRVELVVTDSAGHESQPLAGTIRVAGCPVFAPEIVFLGASTAQSVVGQRVSLAAIVAKVTDEPAAPDGGASAPDGGAPAPSTCEPHFTRHWTLVSVPPGSSASLVDSPLEEPSFVTDVPGPYVAEVYATNDRGRASSVERVTVVAGDCGSHAPTVSSVAATPPSASVGQAVSLAATGSDADSAAPCSLADRLRRVWALTTLPAGSTARLNDSSIDAPSFVPDVPGTYVAEVALVDGAGHVSAPSSTTVTVGTCGTNAPVLGAVTATPAAPASGTNVVLDVTTTDPDRVAPCDLRDPATLDWTLVSVPAGSRAALSGAGQASPWFLADLPGDYVVQVTATDGTGLPAAAPKRVTVTASTCGTAAPVVGTITASPTTLAVGSGVTLTAQVTDADSGGTCKRSESFTYAWSLTAVPAGSQAAIGAASAPIGAFVPDLPGGYTATLVVTDSAGHASAAASRNFTVVAATPSTCGTAAPAARLSSFTAAACAVGVTCTNAAITPAVGVPNVTPPAYTIKLNGHPSVRLDGSGSSDPDAAAPCNLKQALHFTWTIVSAPVGSKPGWSLGTGTTTDMVAPTFVPDVAGVYQVALVVSDGDHESASMVVQIER